MTEASADVAPPEEGKHYYSADDANKEVMRCLVVLDDGRAVLATSGGAQVVDPDKLRSVPTTAGDVLRTLGQLRAALDGGKATDAGDLLSAVEAWVRGIPVPDSEKV